MTLNQFAFDFYLRLRQHGLPLTLEEYKLLLDAMKLGLGIENKDGFLETCQFLWSKSIMDTDVIDTQFKVHYQQLFEKIIKKNEVTSEIVTNEGVDSFNNINSTSIDPDRSDKIKDESVSNEMMQSGIEPYETPQISKKQTVSKQSPPTVIAFYPSTEDDSQGDNLSNQLYSVNYNYIQSPFILSDDYLPISLRQLQQSWRKLRHYAPGIINYQDINWRQTIEKIAQQGFYINPVYKRLRQNQFDLTIIIDHHGSMAAHWPLGQRLIEAAKAEGGYPHLKVYYTHNIPSKFLYKDPHLTDSISIEEMLWKLAKQHCICLFFSDAGASRGVFNPQRVDTTKRFIGLLNKKVKSIAWLNPIPQSRWKNTSANKIKKYVPMFESTEAGIDAAMKALKTGRNARY